MMGRYKNYLKNLKRYGAGYAVNGVLEHMGVTRQKKSNLYIQEFYMSLPENEKEKELNEWYYLNTGKRLNLTHPRTFNEKIQWLKLYDSTPEKTKLADKYLVRDWVKDKIGEKYLIPLLGVWDSFSEIDFSQLPEKFVLKAVHGSGMNLVVKNKSTLNMKTEQKKFDFWMKDFYGIGPMQEWHYRDIPHRIIAEKYMENMDGDLYDYKFYCFNGEPKYIQVIKGRNTFTEMMFYDLDWNDAGFSHEYFHKMKEKVEKPKQLERAIEICKKLSEGFAFVRVDLYLVGGVDIYFGEMTFTPASGVRHWIPEGTDEYLGDLISLNNTGKER